MLYYEQLHAKKKKQVFTWVTSIPLTKAKLWENIRAAFKILTFASMQQLFLHVAELNRVQQQPASQ